MKEIEFVVMGKPKGKERPRHRQLPDGRIVTYTPKNTKEYESKVRMAFLNAGGEIFPPTVPLMVEVTALMPIPRSASKAKSAAMESGIIPYISKPDADNLGKCIDGLNHVAWADDKQITALIVRKRYDKRGGEGCMHIRITDISA